MPSPSIHQQPEHMYLLKCDYYKGMFGHEYMIKFKSSNNQDQEMCFVNKTDVKHIDKKHGLVNVIVKSFKENMAVVEINDTADHKRSRFYVPQSEIVENRHVIPHVLK